MTDRRTVKELGGLHHMTAVTTDAAENVGFYTDVLGLRLVKKTVNQDDVSAYHLFYGDEVGNPGTEITFFDWPQLRVAPNHPGAGEVSTTGLRVPDRAALEWWAGRFRDLGVSHGAVEEGDRAHLDFTDPEGQRLRLAADDGEGVPGGVPWEDSPVPPEVGIRGLGAVDLTVRELDPTMWVLTKVLGFRKVDEVVQSGGQTVTFEVGGGGPGATVRVVERPDAPWTHLGRGGVH
ncbi:MAG: VOC family protein, partial [Rubrobacteraceae bacterium]|nr:VOC family protein [Rubrobacteraceae bacterium]